MRKVKYRAWEKNLKEIIPVHNIDFEKRMINTDSAWRTFDEIELIEYTGLKDKNGKEIYEKDLLKLRIGGTIQATPYEVESAFEFWRHIGEGEGDSYYSMSDFEIIGNIYENPELLEGVK